MLQNMGVPEQAAQHQQQQHPHPPELGPQFHIPGPEFDGDDDDEESLNSI
jgi:hypothetical protein